MSVTNEPCSGGEALMLSWMEVWTLILFNLIVPSYTFEFMESCSLNE